MLDLETYELRASRVYSRSTVRKRLKTLRQYSEFLKRTGMEPGVESLVAWMDELYKRMKPNSVGSYARDVLSYFDVMLIDIDEKKLRSLKSMIPPLFYRKSDYLTVEEVRRLIGVARYPYKLVYALSYAYARRLGEVLRASVDLSSSSVRFPVFKKRAAEVASFRLEGWIRSMVEDYLKSYGAPRGLGPDRLFDVTDRAVERAFKRDCERAGIDPSGRRLSPHVLRHSRIQHLIERGVPIEVVSKYLARHSSVTTTFQFYLAPTEAMASRIPSAEEVLWGSR